MINPLLHIIFFVLTVSLAIAQEELVPNGSFEEIQNCPDFTNGFYVSASKYWYMPTSGTSDYFNSCSQEVDGFGNIMFSVPTNYQGYQSARTGVAYAGYFAALTPNNVNYYEYISVKLNESLQQGKTYKLTYFVSLADSFYKPPQKLQFINHSGAWFSNSMYHVNNSDIIPFAPQVKSDPSDFLNDSLGWQKIEGIFLASGGEEYLTIGCFAKYADLNYNYLPSANSDSAIAVYYYVDDVSLVEFDFFSNLPNIFTPNGDGINDLLRFNSPLIELRELTVVNRWGNTVYQSNNLFEWNGTNKYDQKECVEGVYFFTLRTDYEVYHGHIQLIR